MGISVVLLSVLSMGQGIKLDYLGVGHVNRVVITSAGSMREPSSSIPKPWLGPIVESPGVRRERNGTPLVDAEVYDFIGPLTQKNGRDGATEVRGIGPEGLQMSPEIRIVDGRYYRPGAREVLIGIRAQQQFSGMELGDELTMLDGGKWAVVGHYSTRSFIDGDLIVDPQVMLGALRRTSYNSVLVGLESTQTFEALKRALTTNPALSVKVERQSDFWLRQYQNLPDTMPILIYLVSVLMASGAISAILHTMHATVDARAKEIAILRAVGFGGLPLAVSIVLEAMFFASIGAAVGTAIDWLWLNGNAVTGAYGVFRIAVTPHLLAVAVGWGLVTAFIGAIVPAAQEGHLTVVEALARL
jgi:putative ABC transport system permease protein